MSVAVKGGVRESGLEVIALRIEAGDTHEFLDTPGAPAAGEKDDEIDRLGNERSRHSHDDLLDELLQAGECTACRAGMNCCDPAWVPRAPGLEEIERLTAPDLPDHDPIGPQAQRRAHEERSRRPPG